MLHFKTFLLLFSMGIKATMQERITCDIKLKVEGNNKAECWAHPANSPGKYECHYSSCFNGLYGFQWTPMNLCIDAAGILLDGTQKCIEYELDTAAGQYTCQVRHAKNGPRLIYKCPLTDDNIPQTQCGNCKLK
ncbi:uncharacterized protein MELLADRAFT_123580 [Melampsora larici-populina 98AG31]|uniref:Secreted protein n=1 Tax=Melampsora larici-populina (strain 98AG31 / pathotype 3-4-7) TaxID=747676 RepID=F4R8D1_MELLP|nr:uncharacterized protein MELLADRAFT_123580 [Melampsora larici-populina 98AG31]EGG11631.1 secreted protein [Melampsora larici-populina 98AG31]